MSSHTTMIDRDHNRSHVSRVRKRLAVRQATLVVTIACTLGLLAACAQINFDHSRQVNVLKHLSEKQVTSVEESATNALVELNEDLANAIVKGLLGHEIFMGATLATPNGYVLATQSRERMTNIKAQFSHYLFGEPQKRIVNLNYQDGVNLMKVGSLTVIVDTCSIGEQFLDRAMITLVTGFLKSLALAIAVLIAFYFTLTKPLSSMVEQLNNLNARDKPGKRLTLPEETDIVELQTIADATNTHLGLIEKHVSEIEAARSALRITNQDLEKIVDHRTKGLTKEIEERISAENKLRQALKAAEENASAKSQFLAEAVEKL